jgi:hypothetical protein
MRCTGMEKPPSDFRLRHGILLGIILLAGVPWYWPDDTVRPFILGLPIWAFVSLVMSVLFAATTAWIIMRYWKDDE